MRVALCTHRSPEALPIACGIRVRTRKICMLRLSATVTRLMTVLMP